jgi:hypothetical protein
MIPMRRIQATIVWFVGRRKRRDRMGQTKAPAIPEPVAVIESRAMATVPMWSSVRAKRIAVPETVATASERRNHAMRKMTICRSCRASLMVRKRESQAKER